jgi:hypothetical protein
MIADIGAQFDTAPNSSDTVLYTPDGSISTNILALMKNAIYGEKVDGSQIIIRHPEDNEEPIHPPIEATLAAKQRAKRAAAALHRMRLNPNTNYADPTMVSHTKPTPGVYLCTGDARTHPHDRLFSPTV